MAVRDPSSQCGCKPFFILPTPTLAPGHREKARRGFRRWSLVIWNSFVICNWSFGIGTASARHWLRLRLPDLRGPRSSFFPVLPPNKLVTQGLHLHGEGFDFLGVITPENKGRNGNQQSHQCGLEDIRNTASQFRRIV